MKNTILLLLLSIVCTATASAQISKGQWLAGGDASFAATTDIAPIGNGSTAKTHVTTITLAPGAGYFFIDKLCGGLALNIGWYRNKPDDTQAGVGNSVFTTNTLGLSPFVRYYFLPKANKINLLADARYNFLHQNSEFNQNGQIAKNKFTQTGYSFEAGPAFMVAPHVSLETLLTYSHTAYNGSQVNQFTVTAGFQVHLGK